MAIYFAIAFGILLAVSLFANIRMYQKVSYYESWYQEFATRVKHMRQELYRIDSLGAFRSDDEVGYFFEALKRMSMELFRMGFFEELPEEPDPPQQSAINVTTDSEDMAMEKQQQEHVRNSMGPSGEMEIPPPPDAEQSNV